jgi:hypothetical protein
MERTSQHEYSLPFITRKRALNRTEGSYGIGGLEEKTMVVPLFIMISAPVA